MLFAKYQDAGLCGSTEKNVTEIFCDADADDASDRSDPYMSPPLKRAGDTIKLLTHNKEESTE